MGNYYASRGWVYVSIDYRPRKSWVTLTGSLRRVWYYRGIAPRAWIEHALESVESSKQLQQSGHVRRSAGRQSRAAWVVANADTYKIDVDQIAVGGASTSSIRPSRWASAMQAISVMEITLDDDPTLATTNLNETYDVKSTGLFQGSNVKIELYNTVYGVDDTCQ